MARAEPTTRTAENIMDKQRELYDRGICPNCREESQRRRLRGPDGSLLPIRCPNCEKYWCEHCAEDCSNIFLYELHCPHCGNIVYQNTRF